MNERLEHCLYQAGLTAQGCWDELDDYAKEGIEKFAELIVRECVAQIEIEKGNPYRNMGDENRYGIGACVESIRRIKQHFGVEE
jgi:hypothetical protein